MQRFFRYSLGSVIAFAVSQLVFLVAYGSGAATPRAATLWSYAAGIPVNYLLNRRWAWRRRGRPGMRDEVVPYAAVITLSIVTSALATDAVDAWLRTIAMAAAARVALVGVTFAGITVGLFLAKYVLLDRLVFRDRPRSPQPDAAPRDVERVP